MAEVVDIGEAFLRIFRVRAEQRDRASDQGMGFGAGWDFARAAALPDRAELMASVAARCVARSNGCLEWRGAANKKGYGRVKVGGRLASPHRVAAYAAGIVRSIWEPGRKECVLHACDNPRCCNPKHLWPGTLSDNMQDCAAKGRLGFQK